MCVFLCGIWGKIEPNRLMIVPTIWMIYACWSVVFCERLKNKNEIIKGLDLRSTSERGKLRKGRVFWENLRKERKHLGNDSSKGVKKQ